MGHYSHTLMRHLLRVFYTSVGWTVFLQEDGSLLVRDNHGGCWRVVVEPIVVVEGEARETE